MSRKFRAETPYIVNFGFDSDKLDSEARRELDIQADWIIDHPHVKFRVYGHTDKVGNLAYNTDLGLRRAKRVVAYLMSKGIAEERLEAMASFGEDFPMIETEAAERANRRTLTDVIGFVPVGQSDGEGDGEGSPGLQTRSHLDAAPPVRADDSGQPPSVTSATTTTTSSATTTSGGNPNAGRGNGDEDGDPGKSGGKNNGGDEVS